MLFNLRIFPISFLTKINYFYYALEHRIVCIIYFVNTPEKKIKASQSRVISTLPKFETKK